MSLLKNDIFTDLVIQGQTKLPKGFEEKYLILNMETTCLNDGRFCESTLKKEKKLVDAVSEYCVLMTVRMS